MTLELDRRCGTRLEDEAPKHKATLRTDSVVFTMIRKMLSLSYTSLRSSPLSLGEIPWVGHQQGRTIVLRNKATYGCLYARLKARTLMQG